MSALTRYLSRLLGVFLLVTAASEWTQPGLLTVVAPTMVDQPALLWVSGILTFAAGLAIVLGHHVWGDPAAAVVSLVGCPSAGERILKKTVAKVIRKFCIACKGRYLLTAMLGTASVE